MRYPHWRVVTLEEAFAFLATDVKASCPEILDFLDVFSGNMGSSRRAHIFPV